MSEIPTPRTDAVVAKSLEKDGGATMTEDLLFHARTLERELSAMNEALMNRERDLVEARLVVQGLHPEHPEARGGWLWAHPHGLNIVEATKQEQDDTRL